MSTLRLAIFAAAIMLLGTVLYPLSVRLLQRRARQSVAAGLQDTATAGSPDRSGVGGLVLNMYLTQGIYLLVIWTIAWRSNSTQVILFLLVSTGIKLAVAVKLCKLLRFGFWDFPARYRDYNSYFMWHFIGVPLSLLLDLVMFILIGSQGS
jgi:hypothetical protein